MYNVQFTIYNLQLRSAAYGIGGFNVEEKKKRGNEDLKILRKKG